jgi:hypothetical protein
MNRCGANFVGNSVVCVVVDAGTRDAGGAKASSQQSEHVGSWFVWLNSR